MLESGACQDGCMRLEITSSAQKSKTYRHTCLVLQASAPKKINNSHDPGLVAQMLSLTKMFSMSCLFPDTAYGQ